MAIEIKCPGCSATLRVPDEAQGKKGACPHCNSFVVFGRPPASQDAGTLAEPPWTSDTVFPVFTGHTEPVNSVAISRGGTIAVSASDDGTVRFWDIETGRETLHLAGHSGPVSSAVLSTDGTFALSGGADGTVRLWHIPKAKCVRVLEGHKGPVNSVALFPRGGYAYSAGADGTIRMWELASGKNLRTGKGHKGAVNSISAHPECRMIVSGGADATLRQWRCDKVKELAKLKGHGGPVNSVSFNSDGGFIISGSEDRLATIWSTERRIPVKILKGHVAGVRAVALSFDNSIAATGGADWALKCWNVDRQEELFSLEAEEQWVTGVAFEPGGASLLAASRSGAIRLWDTGIGKLIRAFGGTEHSRTTRCPSCGKVFSIALRLVDREGLCPFCRAKFRAAQYSPDKSSQVVARGITSLDAGQPLQAHTFFSEAIRFQPDNLEAIFRLIIAATRVAASYAETARHKQAIAILDAALRQYLAVKAWPVEFNIPARDQAHDASFLAGKICRYNLEDFPRALQYLKFARKLKSSFEVDDMLAHMPSPAPRGEPQP